MMRTRCLILGLVVTLLAFSGTSVHAAADEQEVRLGQAYAKDLESKYKVITDPAVADRVARIGHAIAQVSDRPTLPYTYKVIQLDVANALSLPGGFIYITTGMLSFVRSDHELAAVLAHETVHAAHSHQMEVIRRSNQALFWTVLLAALTRNPGVLQGGTLVSGAALSGFSRNLERDADLTGISYLVKTDYTPVAMLTIMERLWREVQYSAQPDYGAFRDHPEASERVAYILQDLLKRQIPINRRPAANYLHVSTRPFPDKGQPATELLVDDTTILRLQDASRIQSVAARLDTLFDADPPPFEVNSRATDGGWGVYVGTNLLLVLTPADATYLGFSTPSAAATEITAKLRWVIDQDQRMRRFKG